MPKPTINDIAKALNVTPSTVSRALAGNTRVSIATRQAVMEKAASMGYERNVLASSLRKGSTDIVGMVVPCINSTFFSTAICGAETALRSAGYNLIICQSDENVSTEQDAIASMLRNQVAGLIVAPTTSTTEADLLKMLPKHNFAVVLLGRTCGNISSVVADYFSGACQATKHLIQSGYKRIGLAHSGVQATNIIGGYQKALHDNGLSADENLIFAPYLTRSDGRRVAEKALQLGCDALYCDNNYVALGAIEYAQSCNINIPAQFGIVGTGCEEFTEFVSPHFSSLKHDALSIGSKAAQLLLDIKNEEQTKQNNIVIPMTLSL